MNTPMNDGGPAFPAPLTGKWAGSGVNATFAPDSTDGMALRDWFAGTATDMDIKQVQAEWRDRGFPAPNRREARYRHADDMLAERKKPNQKHEQEHNNGHASGAQAGG